MYKENAIASKASGPLKGSTSNNVEQALSVLDDRIKNLRIAISQLVERIDPLLVPEKIEDGKCPAFAPTPVCSPVAQRIYSLSNELTMAQEAINNLTVRV